MKNHQVDAKKRISAKQNEKNKYGVNVYMPYLFTKELVNTFPNKVKQKFSDYNLIFGQDILSFSPDSLNLRSRPILKGKQNADAFFKEIVKTCDCKNGGGVNPDYAINALKLAMKKASFIGTIMQDAAGYTSKHDLLFITKKKVNNTGEISNDNIIINEIQGFILTQIGECNLLPRVPALQIVCSTNPDVSKYLMYTYIKAVKHLEHLKPHNILDWKTGILELAGSYNNASGLCLYNKFGFREDSTLDHPGCFKEGASGDTLAMRADLSDPGYKDLDDVVIGLKNKIIIGTSDKTSEPMCNKTINVGKADSKAQKLYIKLRAYNRSYLTNLFHENDDNTIKELLDATEIDHDVLKGDGYTDTNYALKELIEKGKMVALNQRRDIGDLINTKSSYDNDASTDNTKTKLKRSSSSNNAKTKRKRSSSSNNAKTKRKRSSSSNNAKTKRKRYSSSSSNGNSNKPKDNYYRNQKR